MTMTAEPVGDYARRLAEADPAARERWVRAHSIGAWAERVRGFENAPFHWEWYRIAETARRVVVVAPRDHSKTECLTINATVHRSIYQPGLWTYVFTADPQVAEELKRRIDGAMRMADPRMVEQAWQRNARETTYANGSRVTVRVAEAAIRSAHPDVIIADDILSEENTRTSLRRKRLIRWWNAAVGGMAHSATTRTLWRTGRIVPAPATRVFAVGTPIHQADLLAELSRNTMYDYWRYAAECEPGELIPGTWAVERRLAK